ncbi:MAG: PASTA domain-containing protein [Thermodesulfovibrionales bacterium]
MGNRTAMVKTLLLLLAALLFVSSSTFAQDEQASDPWMIEMERAKGLTVGDLTPKYGEPAGSPSGDSRVRDSGRGTVTDMGTVGTAGGPVDPNSLDPGSPEVADHIRQWITTARPPENAVEGANVRYSGRGNVVGTVPGGTISSRHETGAINPVYLWTNKRTLDSIDHCTLEEYVVAKLHQKAVSHCAGRYGAVRDLKGMKLAQAKAAVTNKGFSYSLAPGSPAKTPAADGTIEKQEPLPTQYLKKGDSVKLFVHSPYVQKAPTLPDFTGKPLTEAKKWLKKNKLTAKLAPGRPAPSKNLSGTVEMQKPDPGTEIGEGGEITLTVYSNFVDVRRVPDVAGLVVGEAKRRLSDAGLKPVLRPGGQPSSQQQAGTVERQEPSAGTETAPRSEVSIFAYGPYVAIVTVPDVLHLLFEDAEQRLGNAGLTITRKDAGNPQSASQANTVQKQDPAAGTNLEKGDTVFVWTYGAHIPTREELIAGYDCSQVTNSYAAWDTAVNAPRCFCKQGYMLDIARNVCVAARPPTRDELVRGYDCSRVFNSYAAWDTAVNAPRCFCKQGYVLDIARNVCVAARPPTRDELVRGYDCSRVFNSYAAWDTAVNAPRCFCKQGYVLDTARNVCVAARPPTRDELVRGYDCSRVPNSHAVWDTRANAPRCQCNQGFVIDTRSNTCSGNNARINNQRQTPGSCNDPGMTVVHKLIDPPPYAGVSSICRDSSGGLWFQTPGRIIAIVKIIKGPLNGQTGCYDSSQIQTLERTYGGRLCRP